MIQTERSFEEKVLYMNADEKKVIEQIVINTVKKLMEEKNSPNTFLTIRCFLWCFFCLGLD